MKKLARVIVTMCLPMLLASCVIGQITAVMRPTITGSVTIHRPDGTETHWTSDRCASGALEYFAGFDFLSSVDEGHLRVLLDPISGPVLRWKHAGGQNEVLRSGNCSKLDVDVQPTQWRVNGVREFAGHADLQCTLADGSRIEGRVAVDHCH